MKTEKRISNIDFLRGMAALSVLVWHYQHFYFGSSVDILVDRQRQPFFNLLELFYSQGHLAVQFFWVLSGFVFFHIYNSESRRTTSAKDFFIQRFARLYPLHFITVLILQIVSINVTEKYQIYPINDLKHFFLIY